MLATEEREDLVRELDERSARIRQLREREVEATKLANYTEATRVHSGRLAEEQRYFAAYKSYCAGRPAVVDIGALEVIGTRRRISA